MFRKVITALFFIKGALALTIGSYLKIIGNEHSYIVIIIGFILMILGILSLIKHVKTNSI